MPISVLGRREPGMGNAHYLRLVIAVFWKKGKVLVQPWTWLRYRVGSSKRDGQLKIKRYVRRVAGQSGTDGDTKRGFVGQAIGITEQHRCQQHAH